MSARIFFLYFLITGCALPWSWGIADPGEAGDPEPPSPGKAAVVSSNNPTTGSPTVSDGGKSPASDRESVLERIRKSRRSSREREAVMLGKWGVGILVMYRVPTWKEHDAHVRDYSLYRKGKGPHPTLERCRLLLAILEDGTALVSDDADGWGAPYVHGQLDPETRDQLLEKAGALGERAADRRVHYPYPVCTMAFDIVRVKADSGSGLVSMDYPIDALEGDIGSFTQRHGFTRKQLEYGAQFSELYRFLKDAREWVKPIEEVEDPIDVSTIRIPDAEGSVLLPAPVVDGIDS
jgi:hypothetical protein